MLRNLLIFSMCIAAISANGEFSVLSYPKSLSFKGSEPLASLNVGNVLYAATGKAVPDDVEWGALSVNDPFNMANPVVAVLVQGVDGLSVGANTKTYELEGSDSDDSLTALADEVKKDDESLCDMDFSQFNEAVISYRQCFEDESVPALPDTQYLNAALHSADKKFLIALGLINAVAEKLSSKSIDYLIMRVSLEGIAKVHGEKSAALAEGKKMLSKSLTNLNKEAQKSSERALVVVLTSDAAVEKRQKRDVAAPDDKNGYNLAKYYSEDYPVIFNIILWFMVTFGLALLAICYAIADMDPGRDSIIYRMTSTRMKKDN